MLCITFNLRSQVKRWYLMIDIFIGLFLIFLSSKCCNTKLKNIYSKISWWIFQKKVSFILKLYSKWCSKNRFNFLKTKMLTMINTGWLDLSKCWYTTICYLKNAFKILRVIVFHHLFQCITVSFFCSNSCFLWSFKNAWLSLRKVSLQVSNTQRCI